MRYVPSGRYFARLRVHGKLIRRCLKTNKIGVAKIRLADLEKLERQRVETHGSIANGSMKFGDALTIFRQRMLSDGSLKPRSKDYRSERIAALLRSWPALEQSDVRKVTKNDCLLWAANYCKEASPSNFNNTVGTLRMVVG